VVRYFFPARSRAWEYRWRDRTRGWVAGNTLLYWREAWERRPIPALNEGEDTRWVFALPRLYAMTDPSWFAAMVHAGNSRKQTRGPHWHPLELDVVRSMMGGLEPLRSPRITRPLRRRRLTNRVGELTRRPMILHTEVLG
jgi:hypothetical protein